MSTPKTTKDAQPPRATSTDEAPPPRETESASPAEIGQPPLDLVNPGTTALVYDMPGHQLDAGGRVTVSSVDKVGKRAVRNAHLLCQDTNDVWITFDTTGSPVARPVADGASQPK